MTSNYDVNVQLALATTAVHEGELQLARAFLAEARRLARTGRRYWMPKLPRSVK